MINKINLIITAIFSLWLYLQVDDLRKENQRLQEQIYIYQKAYLECNTDRIKIKEILTGDSLKTLIYW